MKEKDNVLDLTVTGPQTVKITNGTDADISMPLYPNDGFIDIKAGTAIKLTVTTSRELAFYYTTARKGLGLTVEVITEDDQ